MLHKLNYTNPLLRGYGHALSTSIVGLRCTLFYDILIKGKGCGSTSNNMITIGGSCLMCYLVDE